MKTGKEVRKGCCLPPILLNVYKEYFDSEVLEGAGDFKKGGQVIRTVKYVDNVVLLDREETVLQGLYEIGRCYAVEMNVEKN